MITATPSIRFDALLLLAAAHGALSVFDQALDHVAADVARLTAGQIAVVALLEVDANLPWCTPVILKCPFTHALRYDEGGGRRHAHRNVKQAPLRCVGRI